VIVFPFGFSGRFTIVSHNAGGLAAINSLVPALAAEHAKILERSANRITFQGIEYRTISPVQNVKSATVEIEENSDSIDVVYSVKMAIHPFFVSLGVVVAGLLLSLDPKAHSGIFIGLGLFVFFLVTTHALYIKWMFRRWLRRIIVRLRSDT
jgi:hypothetical protein